MEETESNGYDATDKPMLTAQSHALDQYTHYSVCFFKDLPSPEIYTLSLHDALPISRSSYAMSETESILAIGNLPTRFALPNLIRSEEHTSELQSPCNLVCRLLLEKKKQSTTTQLRCSEASNPQLPSQLPASLHPGPG